MEGKDSASTLGTHLKQQQQKKQLAEKEMQVPKTQLNTEQPGLRRPLNTLRIQRLKASCKVFPHQPRTSGTADFPKG